MHKRYVLYVSIAMALGVGATASAASLFDITFPISELGSCANKEECKAYCDDFSHAVECSAFAKNHGIDSAQSAEQAAALPDIGPGGCTGANECRTYCDDSAHFDECISFAETHDLMSKKEIDQARKAVVKGPGGCSGLEECKNYCDDEAHESECADYAHEQGLISDDDYKIFKEVQERGGPGGCKDEEECKNYCDNADHLDECISFGEDQGFISHEDAVTIRKAGFGGAGPGGCEGQDACRTYCESPEHQAECIDFAESKGFMSKEEAERARTFAGKTGPGGCRAEECRVYCDDPDHAQECLDHAEREGLIPKEEVERARKFLKVAEEGGPGGCKGQVACQEYCGEPGHEEECFAFGKKQGLIRPEDEQQFEAGMKIKKTMEQSGGPGGCKNDNECKDYCSDASHTEECIAFATAHGGIPEAQARQMLQQFTTGTFSADIRGPEEFQRIQEESFARFQEFKQLEDQFRGKTFPGQGFGPPGAGGFGPPPGSMPEQQFGEGGSFGNGQGSFSMPQFLGPGGCAGPAECIKYCTDHREECFSQGPPSGEQGGDHGGGFRQDGFNARPFGEGKFPDQRGGREGQRGFSPDRGFGFGFGDHQGNDIMPQLRGDIVHELTQEDLPENFEQQTPEQRQQFFQQKFHEFRGEPGGFPGAPSQGFPGNQDPRHQQNNGPQGGFENGFDPFHGMGPQSGTPGIFAPLEGNRGQFPNNGEHQDSFPWQQQPSDMPHDGSFGQPGDDFGHQQFMPGQMTNPSDQHEFGQDQMNQPSGNGPFPGQFQPPFGDTQGWQPDHQMPSGEFNQQNFGDFDNHQWQGGTPGDQPQSFPNQFPQGGDTGGFPIQQDQQFPMGDTSSSFPPPAGGSFPPPSESFGGTFQPPPESSGGFIQPTDGSSMPPPPSFNGSMDGGNMMPPPGDTGGSMPPPPSGFGPLSASFAALLQTLFTR